MTTPRYTPTTEDRLICPINSGRGLSDQMGHKSSSLQRKASLLEERLESPQVKVKCPWRLVKEVEMRLAEQRGPSRQHSRMVHYQNRKQRKPVCLMPPQDNQSHANTSRPSNPNQRPTNQREGRKGKRVLFPSSRVWQWRHIQM
ncbi:hypothetical protein E2C01_032198 [Portunus trituberculatus]|uniref:Uncharacterized protein n=1 Tax=Portunus trituberculatus TaxID=210409 RepID=A0A5B7EZQ0_PORTR|nr:hypothetical protein [Portunus trituberculatus]